MAAAPHLFDDLVVSPELALVDVDLAARLREEIHSGGDFRPRSVVRPEFRLLHPVAVAVEVAPEPPAPEEVAADEITIDVDPVVVALDVPLDSPVDEFSELPDYVIVEAADDVGGAAFLDVAPDPPALAGLSELPDYVVLAEEDLVEDPVPDVGEKAEDEPEGNDYPVLPDLGEASVALNETDVALRKIREQFAAEKPSRRRGVRRGFIAASGLGAIAALAALAVDVQQGFVTLPGWLGF